MSSQYSFWQEILLAGIAMLALLYAFYFRIWFAIAIGADLLFVGAVALCVTSVVTPTPWNALAQSIVDHTPLPAALAAADRRVEEIEAAPGAFLERIRDAVGFGNSEEESEAEDSPPEAKARKQIAAEHQATPISQRLTPEARRDTTSSRRTTSPAGSIPHTAPRSTSKSAPDASTEPLANVETESDHGAGDEELGPFAQTIRPSVDALIATGLRAGSFLTGSFLILTSLATRSSTTTAKRLRQLSARIETLEAKLETQGDASAPNVPAADSGLRNRHAFRSSSKPAGDKS